jgi:hypothetical protein
MIESVKNIEARDSINKRKITEIYKEIPKKILKSKASTKISAVKQPKDL